MLLKQTFIVSGSYFPNYDQTGLGIVIHETDKPGRNGPIIDQICELYPGKPAKCPKQFVIFRALEIAKERGFEIIKIRSDYNQMRKSLKNDYESGNGLNREDLHGEIIRLAREFEEVKFAYKERRKNQMARKLARDIVKRNAPPVILKESVDDDEELEFYDEEGFSYVNFNRDTLCLENDLSLTSFDDYEDIPF